MMNRSYQVVRVGGRDISPVLVEKIYTERFEQEKLSYTIGLVRNDPKDEIGRQVWWDEGSRVWRLWLR
jgi:hypothetical protein